MFLFVQLKKTAEELNDALATKEEIAQRCHELDMQVNARSHTVCVSRFPLPHEMFYHWFGEYCCFV